MPKVSVVMPAFNAQEFIKESLDSVLNQKFQDYEIVVVDDDSTDNTKKIVLEYVKKFQDKISYIHKENGGPASSRNRGIQESSGEYISFLDSDDVWMPDHLKDSVKILEENADVGLVHSNYTRISEKGEELEVPKRNDNYLSGHIFEHLLCRKAHVCCSTVTIKRDCLDRVGLFNESQEFKGIEDRDFWLRLSQHYEIDYVNKLLIKYRRHQGGISKDLEHSLKGKIFIVDQHWSNVQSGLSKKKVLAEIYRETADEYLFAQSFKKARQMYCNSLVNYPLA